MWTRSTTHARFLQGALLGILAAGSLAVSAEAAQLIVEGSVEARARVPFGYNQQSDANR